MDIMQGSGSQDSDGESQQLHEETIQEITLREQVEELQAELGICKAEKQKLESRCQDLEAQLAPNAINIVDLQQEIRELQGQNDSLKEDWAEVSTERDMLYEEKQELEADWAFKLHPIESELDHVRYQAEERRLEIEQVKQKCATALTTILTSDFTGEDIPSALLEPILEFPSIHKFSPRPVSSYKFADRYIGLGNDFEKIDKQDISIVELLRWAKGGSAPTGLTSDELNQVVWMESHLLEDIRTRKKKNTWVVLAFELLFRLAKSSSNWLARCMTYVRLAELSHQYVMYDRSSWSRLINELAVASPQLNDDPLTQVCFAHLALSTDDPASHMNPILARALNAGLFSVMTPIPEVLGLLKAEVDAIEEPTPAMVGMLQENIVSMAAGGRDIVMARFEYQEVVFSKLPSQRLWTCSVEPVSLEILERQRLDVT
ncbi:hypothetical protein KCU78_g516, partial [Aureobasidium melanogenum]